MIKDRLMVSELKRLLFKHVQWLETDGLVSDRQRQQCDVAGLAALAEAVCRVIEVEHALDAKVFSSSVQHGSSVASSYSSQ